MTLNLEHLALVVTALAGFLAGLAGLVKTWQTQRTMARKDVVTSQQEEIDRLCGRIENLEAANQELRNARDEAMEANAQLRGQVMAIQAQNVELSKMNTELAVQVEVQRTRIALLEEERDHLQSRVGELETTLKSLQQPLPGLETDGKGPVR